MAGRGHSGAQKRPCGAFAAAVHVRCMTSAMVSRFLVFATEVPSDCLSRGRVASADHKDTQNYPIRDFSRLA